MQIAIIDGIASERETLKKRVTGQTTRLSLDAAVLDYASGSGFLADAGKEHFDLVLLDIYSGSENGVDTAEELRRFNKDCLLVFITTSPDHALNGFRVRALYILFSFLFLALLLLSCLLFYLMVASLNRVSRFRLENHFFSMQQVRYDRLLTTTR